MTNTELQKWLSEQLAKRDYMKSNLANLETTKDTLSMHTKALQEALAYVQSTAQKTQAAVKFSIEDIVNSMLDAVFPGEYVFELRFVIRRNKTEADLILLESGNEVDPLDGVGGGVSDIVSLGLRIVLLLISGSRKVLVLDEPLKNLSQNKKPLAFSMLQRLCKEMNIQIVAVSHDPLFIDVADKTIPIIKKNGISLVSA